MAIPTISPYKMSEIKSKLLQPALTSHFICQFVAPDAAKSFFDMRSKSGFVGSKDTLENQELIRISCAEASLPGSTVATNDINNDFTGVAERHAYRRIYDDRADFTFYVDKEYRIIDFFENWLSYIVGEDELSAQREHTGRAYNYRVNFPNLYKAHNLNITKFEKDYSGRVLSYDFINAYPISINSMPVSYDSSQLLKCTVSFTYSRYVISRAIEQLSKPPTPNRNTNSQQQDSDLNRPTLAVAAEQNPSLGYSQRTSFFEGEEIINSVNSYNQPR